MTDEHIPQPDEAFVELEGQANHAEARRRREALEAMSDEELVAEAHRRGLPGMDLGDVVRAVETVSLEGEGIRRVGPPAPYTLPGNDQDPGPIGTAAEGDAAHARTDTRHEGWTPHRLGMERPATLADVDARLARLERLLLGDGR